MSKISLRIATRALVKSVVAVGLITGMAIGAITQAQAAGNYPWCLQGAERLECMYETNAQCRAMSSGMGGSCVKFG